MMMGDNKRSAEESLNFDGKKSRVENEIPSRVLHFRNLPTEATESDLSALCQLFGRVVNVLLLKGKSQGFVQMFDIASASALVTYYKSTQASVRGRPVYIQFSQREEITAQPQAAGGMGGGGGGDGQPSCVLLVSVLNVMYPITVDVLHTVFCRFGTILRIVTFTKNSGLQALIQFSDPTTAATAKQNLDGQNVYTGCCTLRIQFSSLSTVTVKFNNEKSRDYTNPNLPTDGAMPGPHGGMFDGNDGSLLPGNNPYGQPMGMMGGMGDQYGMGNPAFGGGPFGGMGGMGGGGSSVLLVNNLDPERMTCQMLFSLFSCYGRVDRVKILFNKRESGLIQFHDAAQAESAKTYLDGATIFGRNIVVSSSKHSNIQLSKDQNDLTKDFADCNQHRFPLSAQGAQRAQSQATHPSAVLHLSNLAVSVTQDEVVQLFSQFGPVLNFRFLPRKEDAKGDRAMALIQMQSPADATVALMTLHQTPVHDANLRVSFTKSTMK